jgi:photosystem II stability/assembly factor-like uncharacterized protein
LPGTVVRLNTGLAATSGNDGSYLITGTGGGSFTLQFEKYDWRRKSLQVSVAANETLTVDTMKLDSCRWEIVSIPLSMPWAAGFLEDLCFVSENEGWAVGSDQGPGYPGYIIHTTDGGYTWEMQFGAQPLDAWYFHNVDFVDNQCGWAVGSGTGQMMKKTDDGGVTWVNIATPVWSIWAMDFIDRSTGWVAEYISGGRIYKTTDGGSTWQLQANFEDSSIVSMKLIDASRGFIRGDRKVYATNNGGIDWSLIFNRPTYSGGFPYCKIEVLPSGHVWIDGYYSPNGGLTWERQPCDTMTSITGISFVDNNYGWMSGRNYIIHTTDGGDGWEKYDFSSFILIPAVQFLNPWLGYAIGKGGPTGNAILIYK